MSLIIGVCVCMCFPKTIFLSSLIHLAGFSALTESLLVPPLSFPPSRVWAADGGGGGAKQGRKLRVEGMFVRQLCHPRLVAVRATVVPNYLMLPNMGSVMAVRYCLPQRRDLPGSRWYNR